MKVRHVIAGLVVAAVGLVAACDKKPAAAGKGGAETTEVAGRCPHDIKKDKCPFCTPELVEREGFCAEHGVAEALCTQCRPYLKAAFRAKGDWCEEHKTPESQCVQCHPELKENMKAGAGHGVSAGEPAAAGAKPEAAGACEHGIATAKCPFCTPSLVESDGFCKEHDVAEALCVKCRPYLEAAFKAKGDWCKEHGTPESQCVQCNPDLKQKPAVDKK